MNFVLDASVVLKWYVPEKSSDVAMRLKDQIEESSQLVAVPESFFLESSNALWKKSFLVKELPSHDAKGILSRILDLPFYVIKDEILLLKALDLALVYGVSVYDGMYLACALQSKAKLVTDDAALIRRLANSEMSKWVMLLTDF